MADKTIKALVEGGKASGGAPLGPALGPLGVDIQKVVAEINEKTKNFTGATVPVSVIVDLSTKDFRIEVGTPPTSSLIKQEIAVKKGSSKAAEEKVGDITIDQIIKISRMKEDNVHAKTKQKAVKEVIGSCVPMGVLVETKDPREVQKEVDTGKYDDKIEGKVELQLPTKEEIEKKRATFSKAIEEKRAAEEIEKAAAKAEKEAKAAEAEAEKPEEDKEEEKKEEAPAEGEKKEEEPKEEKKKEKK